MPATTPPELASTSSVDVEPSREDRVSSAWLAALALGLAYSERSDPERRAELAAAAGGSPAALRAARDRLVDVSVADPVVQGAALDLLAGAIAASVLATVRAPVAS